MKIGSIDKFWKCSIFTISLFFSQGEESEFYVTVKVQIKHKVEKQQQRKQNKEKTKTVE